MADNNRNKNKRPKGRPNPLGNPVSMGRYAKKLFRDMAHGNFNIYSDGKVFEDTVFVDAALNTARQECIRADVHIKAIMAIYARYGDPQIQSILSDDTRTYTAYKLIFDTLSKISMTKDTGFLAILCNQLRMYRNDL